MACSGAFIDTSLPQCTAIPCSRRSTPAETCAPNLSALLTSRLATWACTARRIRVAPSSKRRGRRLTRSRSRSTRYRNSPETRCASLLLVVVALKRTRTRCASGSLERQRQTSQSRSPCDPRLSNQWCPFRRPASRSCQAELVNYSAPNPPKISVI